MENGTNIKNQEIQIGDFISATYKCYGVDGVVIKVNKSIVVINKTSCVQQRHADGTFTEVFTTTGEFMNITKSRINRIGLLNNVGYCKNQILIKGA